MGWKFECPRCGSHNGWWWVTAPLLAVLLLTGCQMDYRNKDVVEAATQEAQARRYPYKSCSITYCDSPEEIGEKAGGLPAKMVKDGKNYAVVGRCRFGSSAVFVMVAGGLPDYKTEDERFTLAHELGHWLLETCDEELADEFAEKVMGRLK